MALRWPFRSFTLEMTTRSRTKQPLLMAFGALLEELRHRLAGGDRLSHEAVARLVVQRSGGVVAFGGPTLWRWEQGQVWSPDPLALKALAAVYTVRLDALLLILERNRADATLSAAEAHRLFWEAIHDAADTSAATSENVFDDRFVLDLAQQIIDLREQLQAVTKVGDALEAIAGGITRRQITVARHRAADRDARDRATGRQTRG